MNLTNEVIDLVYKQARIFVKGNRRLNFEDMAHDAIVRLVSAPEPPAEYVENKIRYTLKKVYWDLYTNKSTRKHNVMLEAVHWPYEHATHDVDTVAVRDEFGLALKRLYNRSRMQFELMTEVVSGKSVPELAKERGVSTQAVHSVQGRARQELAELLTGAA